MSYKIEINQRAGERISGVWIKKIVGKTLAETKIGSADISVAFVGNQEIKKWNKQYRGKDKVTDVLSFDYRGRKTPIEKTQKNAEISGEIIVCCERAVSQAKEHGWSAEREIKLLLVHGLLHLAGYDHEKSLKEARKMEKFQEKILKFLK
jgi:probable rRNA maturation factor